MCEGEGEEMGEDVSEGRQVTGLGGEGRGEERVPVNSLLPRKSCRKTDSSLGFAAI